MFNFLRRRRKNWLLESTEEDEVHVEAESSNYKSKKRGGSTPGRVFIDRNRKEGHEKLVRDYFSANPTYNEKIFRRRYRMSRDLFNRIHEGVVSYDNYFIQSRDTVNKVGLSSLQKVTAALRMMAYGVSADMIDENLQIAESTANEAMKKFVEAVIVVFGERYLRQPNSTDIARLLQLHEDRGFPGMLGSLDCMHWSWKNCPSAWKGHYSGHHKEATLILETVASRDLWIWHSFFGLPRSLNDIKVLERSPLFTDIINGRAPPVNFVINNHHYDMGYYLGDAKNFAKAQEGARKDVERAFGVLQARFLIIRQGCRYFKIATLKNIMKACVILHNMVVEHERDMFKSIENGKYYLLEKVDISELDRNDAAYHYDFDQFIKGHQKLKNKSIHRRLQEDLVEHLWELRGNVE
ncbi:putative nuclease HARBI1 [Tripterygium wilfordii]|uniref:putative nuclease HARBI1 n=1 Tax=Tripterygium wilfordii TaxID=458696 RepID=UPI0018F84A03|nr:putative nuclease HARBI1 [Tripterygium wilfordii]